MSASASLLPAGYHDTLPPDADARQALWLTFYSVLRDMGFQLVDPALAEFEETLVPAIGGNSATNTFRIIDPQSHATLALRADITPQVARIAATRLADAARPLRLCYYGQVLRLNGTATSPARQLTQAGFEIFASDTIETDVAMITTAVQLLRSAGIAPLSIDLCVPQLVRDTVQAAGLNKAAAEAAYEALQHKNPALLEVCPEPVRATITPLLTACGRLAYVEEHLTAEHKAHPLWQRINGVASQLTSTIPDVGVTLDIAEHQGFPYQSGVCFSIFTPGLRGEIGRGGRYQNGLNQEPACGFSLVCEPLLRLLTASS